MTTTVSPNLEIGNSKKNVIINGDFDIWQRAISQTANGIGSADRWRLNNTGNTKTLSRTVFSVGQSDVPNNPKYYATIAVTTGVAIGDYTNINQQIENVSSFSGETVTISFWAKADSNKNISTEMKQDFGTGGSPSTSVVGLGITTHTLTTSWQKFSVTSIFPSIAGKTLGTNGDDAIQLTFWLSAGSTFDARTNSLGNQSGTFDIAQVQMEKGSYITNFEHRNKGEELALCQRYFEKTYNTDVLPATITDEGRILARQDKVASGATLSGHNMLTGYFRVTKRVIPTMVGYNPTTGTVGEFRDSLNGTNHTIDYFYQPGEGGFGGVFSVSAIDTNKKPSLHWTADAEL